MAMNLLSDVARLSDRELLAQLKNLGQREREATVALVAHLVELDERRLYLAEGYPSLFKYCTDVLHLSEYATYNRIVAARAVRRFPVLLEHLAAGRVNLFAVRLLAPHLTLENQGDVLTLARYKSQREIEELVARLRPQPPIPDVVRKLPTRTNAATESTALLAATAPPDTAALAPARRAIVSPLAPERYKIQFTATEGLHGKLREAQALLRHQIPDGDLEKIFDRALDALLAHLRKQKLAATERPQRNRSRESNAASGAATNFGPGSRHIPAAVKRVVWERDGGRCAFVSASGTVALHPNMPKARINGFELHYEEGGTGAPVVYVHGGYAGIVTRVDPGEWDWEHDFATHFGFVSYDRRGCYRSEFVDHGLEPINQAKDLENLLDYLSIHTVHVIGSSAGGPIALLFTTTRPDRVRSLILTGTALDLFPPDHITATVRERVRVLEAQGTEVAYETRPSGIVASMEELWRKKDAEARGRPDEFLKFQRRLTVRAEGLPREERLRLFAAELRNLKAYLDLDLLPKAQRIAARVPSWR